MVIQGDGSQCGDVDAILLIVGNLLRENRVQCVVAFKNDNVARADLQFPSIEFPFATDEVVAWQFHLLAVEQLIHLFTEECCVHSLDAFEVVFAVFVEWCVDAVDEVVVGRERVWVHSAGHQLYGQSLAGCGLSATAGSGQQHQLGSAFHNLVGHFV